MPNKVRVERAYVQRGRPPSCDKHGPQYDHVIVDRRPFCLHCLAARVNWKQPWFYTTSPFADEILALGIPSLEQNDG